MSVLLIDASVWLAALDPKDRNHDAARGLVAIGPGERDMAALDLTVFEVANVALKRWRSPSDARRLVELVEIAAASNLVRVDGELADYTIRMADEHGLTAYDAAYVAVTRRFGWTLVSLDYADLVEPGHAVAPDAVAAVG